MKKAVYLVLVVPLFICVACLIKGTVLLIGGDYGGDVMGWWFGSVFALLVTMSLAGFIDLHSEV